MRHIKDYKTFEGVSPMYNYGQEKWADFLDILRAEDIVTDFGLNESDLKTTHDGLEIKVDWPKEKLVKLANTIRATWERTKYQTGYYPHVKSYSNVVTVALEKTPTQEAVYGELGLELATAKDNGYTNEGVESGVIESFDQLVGAIEYLNKFRPIAYRSEINDLKRLYDGLNETQRINRILLNVYRFEDERDKQYVAVIFELEGVRYNPVFVINTARINSTYVYVRYDNSSWDHLDVEEALKHKYVLKPTKSNK